MASQSITVEGMTCNSCMNKVTNAVTAVNGVDEVDVDIATGEVSVFGSEIDLADVRAAVEGAGYRVAS